MSNKYYKRENTEAEMMCNMKNNRNMNCNLPCGTKCLRVLTFAIFSAIRKNKFPQMKITANIFSANIYPRVNTVLRNRV